MFQVLWFGQSLQLQLSCRGPAHERVLAASVKWVYKTASTDNQKRMRRSPVTTATLTVQRLAVCVLRRHRVRADCLAEPQLHSNSLVVQVLWFGLQLSCRGPAHKRVLAASPRVKWVYKTASTDNQKRTRRSPVATAPLTVQRPFAVCVL